MRLSPSKFFPPIDPEKLKPTPWPRLVAKFCFATLFWAAGEALMRRHAAGKGVFFSLTTGLIFALFVVVVDELVKREDRNRRSSTYLPPDK